MQVYESSGPGTVTIDADGSLSTGTALSFAWAFGDGASAAGAWVTHTYAAPGSYELVLTVTDAEGRTASASQVVMVAEGDPPSPPAPPTQPASGPGGSQYAHGAVASSLHGTGGTSYWLFEPQSPAPAIAPVIVFLHGYGAIDPGAYQAWLEHLARKGRIVIFPAYQDGAGPGQPYYDNMIAAVTDAIAELQNGAHVMPDLSRVAVFGHSFGGTLTANYAATWEVAGLPKPQAAFCMAPGVGGETQGGPLWQAYKKDYSQIDADTLLLGVALENDDIVGSWYAEAILQEAAAVPAGNKNLLVVRADDHGQPQLPADHGGPTTGLYINGTWMSAPNATDWYGFWKWGDALCDAAWSGMNRAYALGNTPQQRFMGRWSDGVAVLEPLVGE
jgi:acetyl esterase/lipase